MSFDVAAFYRFVALSDLDLHRAWTLDLCRRHQILGTILIAPEGVNATIAGAPDDLAACIDGLDARFGIRSGELKFSHASEKPFQRMKVRLKKEIITMRQPDANPALRVGTYVEPEGWNDLIADPDVVVLDTRNHYETAIGIFKNAVDPKTQIFTEFADYVQKNLDPARHKKIAMYCTGGIRCEKASSYMLAQGFEEVYHLKGGILKYLETIPADQSLWDGECYVFDRRVAVGHALEEGQHESCFGCGYPLSPEDRAHPDYEEGVSCAKCLSSHSPQRIAALRERHARMTR